MCLDNIITENIIVADGSSMYCFINPSNDPFNNLIDRNCYWPINGAKLASLNSVDKLTIAEMQSAWQNFNFSYRNLNDQNSVMQDPLLCNPANLDFRVKRSSPCWNMARPDINGRNGPIGASFPDVNSPSFGGQFGRQFLVGKSARP